MGCRSFLTPYVDPETGKPKYYGRFNQGVKNEAGVWITPAFPKLILSLIHI